MTNYTNMSDVRTPRLLCGRTTVGFAAVLVMSFGCTAPPGREPAGNTNTGSSNTNTNSGPEPVFPANYRETFTEVRDCRFGIEHAAQFRVLANAIALRPYLDNANPLPVGSILVKEEYSGVVCTNDAQLSQWRVMRKEAPGFDPADGDWHWQIVAPDRRVMDDTKATCIACHHVQDCLDRDYMCTQP